MFAVEVREAIMIAHSLPDPFFGPAQNKHGATFVVDVAFFRRELSEHNVVVDIGRAERHAHALQPFRTWPEITVRNRGFERTKNVAAKKLSCRQLPFELRQGIEIAVG